MDRGREVERSEGGMVANRSMWSRGGFLKVFDDQIRAKIPGQYRVGGCGRFRNQCHDFCPSIVHMNFYMSDGNLGPVVLLLLS